MIWTKRDGQKAPREAVETAARATAEFAVPVGVLLSTVECESDFRLDAVSSAGAVGPCQFLPGVQGRLLQVCRIRVRSYVLGVGARPCGGVSLLL